MLMIDNDVVKRVLTMRECIEAQERAFAGTLTGASVSRPRTDMFVPCNREDGYYRWGSVEGGGRCSSRRSTSKQSRTSGRRASDGECDRSNLFSRIPMALPP